MSSAHETGKSLRPSRRPPAPERPPNVRCRTGRADTATPSTLAAMTDENGAWGLSKWMITNLSAQAHAGFRLTSSRWAPCVRTPTPSAGLQTSRFADAPARRTVSSSRSSWQPFPRVGLLTGGRICGQEGDGTRAGGLPGYGLAAVVALGVVGDRRVAPCRGSAPDRPRQGPRQVGTHPGRRPRRVPAGDARHHVPELVAASLARRGAHRAAA